MVSSCGGCIFGGIFFFNLFLRGFVVLCFRTWISGVESFQFVSLTVSQQQLSFRFYKSLPTEELSSSTTSTFLSLYSTLKSSIRGCLSTICLDGTTWRNAEEEEGAEEAAAEWLEGPYAGPCKVSTPYSLKDRQMRWFKQNSLICLTRSLESKMTVLFTYYSPAHTSWIIAVISENTAYLK